MTHCPMDRRKRQTRSFQSMTKLLLLIEPPRSPHDNQFTTCARHRCIDRDGQHIAGNGAAARVSRPSRSTARRISAPASTGTSREARLQQRLLSNAGLDASACGLHPPALGGHQPRYPLPLLVVAAATGPMVAAKLPIDSCDRAGRALDCGARSSLY
jgi:hypothetical protein